MTDEELLSKLEDSTKDADRRQLETLSTILERNGAVRYLQPFLKDISSPIDAVTFRLSVPLSSYDDFVDLINRMADGYIDSNDDWNLLSVDRLVCFFYSSGTSSMKPKMIPYFDSPQSKAVSFIAHRSSLAIRRKLFPPRPSVNKVLMFAYAGNVTYTKSGHKVMAASAYPMHSNNANASLFHNCASPRDVFLGSDVQQQMYCHLLCGLRNLDLIDGIHAPYAAGLVKAFSLLLSKWAHLCDDLECGSPGAEISDDVMKDSVIQVLGGPQPDLSRKIRSICEEASREGILCKLWPNARYIKCVLTGSMKQYYPKIKYYAGDIPVIGGDYFASECVVAMNLDILKPPELTRYVILPTAAFFEFLPYDFDQMNENCGAKTVDFAGVEVGKMYEVVLTTYRGLYRYRLGDIVRVTGFYNSSPLVEFVMRAPKASVDLLTESQLVSAMGAIEPLLKGVTMAEMVEFASFSNSCLGPNRLKIFVEFSKELKEEKLEESASDLGKWCSSLDDSLGGLYRAKRVRGEIGCLLFYVVKPGSFDKLSQIAIRNGAPASQYKPPKVIRNLEAVDFLESAAMGLFSGTLEG